VRQWYLPSEIAGLPGLDCHPDSIRRMGRKGQLTRRKRTRGKGWEYHIDSLPEPAQGALRQAQAGASAQAAAATDSSAVVVRVEVIVRVVRGTGE